MMMFTNSNYSICLINNKKKGMAGFFGVIGYALYNYRNKAKGTKTSVYVIQTRVAAQGLVIGVLLLGLGKHMYDEIQDKKAHPDSHHK